MNFNLRFAFGFSSLMLVTACSSGGGGTDEVSTRLTYAEYDVLEDRLEDETASLLFTDPGTFPTTGTATHDGFVELTVEDGTPDELSTSGALVLTLDFANDTVTGSVTDLVDSLETQYEGTLAITGGTIDRMADPVTQDTFVADLDGTIINPDNESFVVDAELIGDVMGGGDYVFGNVEGTINGPDGLQVIDDGDFIGERR